MKNKILFALTIFSISLSAQDLDSLLFIKAQKRYPTLEPCEFPQIQAKGLCGTFQVYENHETQNGKKIPLKIIVFPAEIINPPKSAFTYHWGGNGSSAEEKIWMFRSGSPANKIRALKDIILIDDRGTGASNIRCKAMDTIQPYSYAFVYDENRIINCLNELKDSIDLTLYTTSNVIKDMEEVRQWLDIEQFDFYGTSYGVRVGLEYMRNYPERIRTMTVKGCVPPGFNYVNEMDLEIDKQLNILNDRCRADSICNTYYPDFKKELFAIKDRLKDEVAFIEYPVENKGNTIKIMIDDLLFRRMVGHQILNGDANETLPMLIHEAYKGQYLPLIFAGGNLSLDMPVFLSQFCPEEIDRFDYRAEAIGADSLFTEGAIAEEKKFACNLWQKMPAATWLDEPLKGDSPVLIITGENDANTGIKMGEQVKAAFPNQSKHFILPFQGHASRGGYKCQFDIVTQFIKEKSLDNIDVECLEEIKMAPFVFSKDLSPDDFQKFTGIYTMTSKNKKLSIFTKMGMYYLTDEWGDAQIYWQGDNTFKVQDCTNCKIVFTLKDQTITEVKTIYNEVEIYHPE